MKSQEPINTKGSDNITKKAFYKKGKTSLLAYSLYSCS